MKLYRPGILITLCCLLFNLNQPAAGEPVNPLQPFERLVGGKWTLGDSYQEFEWGVGKTIVKSRNFFVIEGKAQLVSEGFWYWHPAEQAIRGTFGNCGNSSKTLTMSGNSCNKTTMAGRPSWMVVTNATKSAIQAYTASGAGVSFSEH